MTELPRRFGDVVAVDALSLGVEAGCTFGLLGSNGAGSDPDRERAVRRHFLGDR